MTDNLKPREGGSKKLQFNTADGYSKLKSPAGLLERSITDSSVNSEIIEDGVDHGPGLKKKGFQITSVTAGTLHPGPDHAEDSLDDLDETSHTEDVSCSDLLDNSLKTDDQEGSSAASSPSESDRVSPSMVASNGAQSRFKVVKIESREPFHRGRWMCRDFLDPSPEQPPVLTAKDSQVDTSSASSSNITSVYQKSDGKSVDLGQSDHKMAVSALRQDNKPSQNSENVPLPADSSVNVLNEPAGNSISLQPLDLPSITKVPLNDGTSSTVSENDDVTSTGMVTANTSQAVLEHVENILATDADGSVDSSASNSTVAIDNKIEQAMDLVKSHLMVAVREEVDILKEKIVELTDRISQLEYENTILKNNATQETLAQLQQPRPAAPSTNATS